MTPSKIDPSAERRGERRHLCHRHCLVRFDRRHLDGEPGFVGVEGYVSDLSAGGVGLLLRPAIPVGATLTIVPFGSAAAKLPPAEVVHCVQAGRRWRHGCRLQRRLDEKELRGWLM
jgi:hypothetical protein